MQLILLLLAFVFLVVLAPVFLIAMANPSSFATILTYWTTIAVFSIPFLWVVIKRKRAL